MTAPIYRGGNFYVYLITDLNPHSEARYYIGSCTRVEVVEKNINPEEHWYYGSSSVPEFRVKQNQRSSELERVIIEVHDDKEECVLAEEWYQRQHQAVENPLFYNGIYAGGKFSPTVESERNRLKTVNDPEWKATVGRERTQKRMATVNDPEWKETVGKEAKRKELKTKSDPKWQATVGKEASRKMKGTKNDPEWKETTGKDMRRKHKATKNDPKWKETVGKEASRKTSETMNDPEWQATVGVESKRKRSETINTPEWQATVGKEASRKMKATKNDPEWKETVGKEASRKVSETVSDPVWKATVGVERNRKKVESTRRIDDSGLNGYQRAAKNTGREYRAVGHNDFGEYRSRRELSVALGGKVSATFLGRLAKDSFKKVITKKSITCCQYLQELPFNPEGMTWVDLGFYIVDE